MNHIELLERHNACDDAVEWASQYPDLATAWDNCHRPDWMLWLNDKGIITISDRDLCLFACDCVRYTPIGYGRTVWNLLTDERSRNAVEVAERYANGEATVEELAAAWEAERYAARDVAGEVAGHAAWYAAWEAAWEAEREAEREAARYAAWEAERDVAGDVAGEVAGDVARHAARAFQADLLRKRVGNPIKGGHEL